MTTANDSATDSALPPPQFRKTKTGKWAVVAPVPTLEAALASGGTVSVLKKSGDWGTFSVSSLGRPFDVDGIAMCYGYGPDDDSEASTARPAATRRDLGHGFQADRSIEISGVRSQSAAKRADPSPA